MIEMKIHGMDRTVQLLKTLPAEIVSRRGGPVRAALRRAAKVILEQERINLQRWIDIDAPTQPKPATLLLKKSLMVTRGKAPFDGKGERYLVRIRRNIYTRATPEKVSTLKSAQLLEYGRKGQPMRPWVRPAYLQKGPEAQRVFEDFLRRSIDQIVARLKRG